MDRVHPSGTTHLPEDAETQASAQAWFYTDLVLGGGGEALVRYVLASKSNSWLQHSSVCTALRSLSA